MLLDEAFEKVGMPLIAQLALQECYEQEHRHYHNLDHLHEMLKWIPEDHTEIEILIDAILFHDIVHAPYPLPAGLNEALSIAEYLSYNTKAMAVNIPFGRNEGSFEYERRVIEAINATSRHTEDQQFLGDVSKLVLDLDLSTFALPWTDYLVWKERIERENLAIWSGKYSPEDINRGRCIFLQMLLKRNRLYYTKTEWEEQARANIQKDINSY
jgi:predicted metal-dependent HD superfamily phosphohydrolase